LVFDFTATVCKFRIGEDRLKVGGWEFAGEFDPSAATGHLLGLRDFDGSRRLIDPDDQEPETGFAVVEALDDGAAGPDVELLETGEGDFGGDEFGPVDDCVVLNADGGIPDGGISRGGGGEGVRGAAVLVLFLVKEGGIEPEFGLFDANSFGTVLDTSFTEDEGLFAVRQGGANHGPFLEGMAIETLHRVTHASPTNLNPGLPIWRNQD